MDALTKGGGLNFKEAIGGEAIPAYRVVYTAGDGRWYMADANVFTSSPILALTTEPLSIGQKGLVLMKGVVQNMNWAFTAGADLYLSETQGQITDTAPTGSSVRVFHLGGSITSNTIFFDPTAGGAGYGECDVLEGATAYVGFDECKEHYVNYFLCDGTADDVQINLAIQYTIGLGGGKVLLERGTYTVIDQVIIDGSDVWFCGIGSESEIVLDATIVAPVALALVEIQGPVNDVTVSDMTIDANGVYYNCLGTQTNETNAVTALRFLRIHAYNGLDDCIKISGSGIDGAWVKECWVIREKGTRDAGVHAGIETEWNCKNVWVEDNYLYLSIATQEPEPNWQAIDHHNQGGEGLNIRNNIIYWRGTGIQVAGENGYNVKKVLIEGNIILPAEDGMSHGIKINNEYIEDVVVHGNIISLNVDGGDTRGISNDAVGTIISNNVIDLKDGEYEAGYGISCQAATEVYDNYIIGGETYGIRITAPCKIIGNVLYNGVTGIRVYHADAIGSLIADNHISTMSTHGIDTIADANELTIHGNYIREVDGRGIRIYASSYTSVTDNRIIGPGPYYGLEILNAQDHLMIHDNIISECDNNRSIIFTNATGTFSIRDNIGYNPIGIIANAFDTAENQIEPNGIAAIPTANTDYTINGPDIKISSTDSGNTNCAIMLKDPAGNNVLQAALSTIDHMYVPTGFKLNWGAYTGTAPTVTVAFN